MGKKRKRDHDSSRDRAGPRELEKRLKRLEKEIKHLHSVARGSPSSSDCQSRSLTNSPAFRSRAASEGRDRVCSRSNLSYQSSSGRWQSHTRSSISQNIPHVLSDRERSSSLVRGEKNGGADSSLPQPADISDAGSISDDVLDVRTQSLSEDFTEILGSNPEKNLENDFLLHEELAPRWRHIIIEGLPKVEITDLLNKFSFPGNLSNLSPPKLNPEFISVLDGRSLARDGSYLELQNHLGKGLCALGKALNVLLSSSQENILDSRKDIISSLSDTGKILSNLIHRISITRKNLISPFLNKNIKTQIESSKPSDYLFGSDLAERVKLAKSLESTSKDLKVVKPKVASTISRSINSNWSFSRPRFANNTNLNFRRPARRRGETRPTKGQPPESPKRHHRSHLERRRMVQ